MTCSPLCMPLPITCRFVRSCCMCMHGCGVGAVWEEDGRQDERRSLASDDARAFATGLTGPIGTRLSGRSKTKQNDGLKCCKGLTPNVRSLNSFVFALKPRICSFLPASSQSRLINTPQHVQHSNYAAAIGSCRNTTIDCGSFAFSHRSYPQKNTCGSPKVNSTMSHARADTRESLTLK